jgi:hypothetical protein
MITFANRFSVTRLDDGMARLDFAVLVPNSDGTVQQTTAVYMSMANMRALGEFIQDTLPIFDEPR